MPQGGLKLHSRAPHGHAKCSVDALSFLSKVLTILSAGKGSSRDMGFVYLAVPPQKWAAQRKVLSQPVWGKVGWTVLGATSEENLAARLWPCWWAIRVLEERKEHVQVKQMMRAPCSFWATKTAGCSHFM